MDADRYVDPTEQLVVEVFVADLDRSLSFYEDLGFERVRASDGFAVLTWEDHQLYLDERSDPPEAPSSPPANVRVMVPDADAHWERFRELGIPVVAPIDDRAYGLRDFTVADPDGFGVRFGTRID